MLNFDSDANADVKCEQAFSYIRTSVGQLKYKNSVVKKRMTIHNEK